MDLNNTDWFRFFNEIDVRNESVTTEDVPVSVVETVVVSSVLVCIILATIFGNVLVLLAVYVNSHLRSTTNYFIVNLAVADLLLGITVLPFSASLETLNYWPFGYFVCDLWASADVLWCTASIWTLCVISIDRYIGVTRPLQHSTIILERRAVWVIICLWILSVAISIAPLIGWKEQNQNNSNDCTVTKQVGYVMFSVAGSFYIPMLIIMFVYAKIYREATKHSKYLNRGALTTKIDESNGVVLRIHMGRNSQSNIQHYRSSSSSEHSECSNRKLSSRITLAGKLAKFNKEKKAAKTLGIVVGVFLICWFPFFFCLPLDVLCDSCNVPDELFTVIFWLGYCNSLMNPIIYACSSKEFKTAFIRVLRCQFQRKPRLFLSNDINSASNLIRQNSPSQNNKCQGKRVTQTLSNDDILFTNYSVAKRHSDSPMISLCVFQERRKRSSNSLNYERSDKTSTSDIEDDECSENILANLNCSRKNTNSLQHTQIGSFVADEHYIDAFRNLNNHAVTVL